MVCINLSEYWTTLYVLTSAKLNTTGLRWVGELTDVNFEIQCRPGKLNTDADSLLRIPADFKNYMDSYTEKVLPESLQASVCGIHTLSSGDSIRLMALTDDEGELHQVDILSQAGCNQVKVVNIVRAQKEGPHIGHVLKFIKANQKPTVQKQKEPPFVRKILNEWHKLYVDKKSCTCILYCNQKIVLTQKF